MPRDFVLYILPFGLVRLRTFHLAHGLVRCNINAGVHVRVEDASFTDVKIKFPDRKWDWGCGLRIWEFEKKQLVEFLLPNKGVDIQSWARPDEFVCYGHRTSVGLRADDVKAVSIERLCVSLSSCQKTFNSNLKQFRECCVFHVYFIHPCIWLCKSRLFGQSET